MSLRKNVIYNSILTLSQYAIGLITLPYISRILGVSNIGIIFFVDNTIRYFVLLSTIGIGIIGAREIARYRNDHEKLNSVFSSLVTILIITTTLVTVTYFIAVLCIPQLHIYKELFYIGSAKIVFNVFLIEWFFRGIENFRYITIRNIVVKLLFVFSLFIFVRNSEDYQIYFVLTTIVAAINAIINFVYARNFVRFSFRSISLRQYFKESLTLGSYAILTSMYTTFNVVYLGWVTNTVQVGYYWVAITIYSITLGFFTAFTGVMMPRMSSLLAQGKNDAFRHLINRSFNVLFTVCFPLIIGSIILAPQIINILSGEEFKGAIIPMQIIMLLVLVVGLAQVLAVQVLMPMKKDRMILTASFIGASIGIILNVLLVKTYGSIGTAIVILISEISVTSFYVYMVYKNKYIEFPWKSLFNNLFFSIPYFFICLGALLLFDKAIIVIVSSVFASALYFVLGNIYILKNSELIKVFQSIRRGFIV